MACVLVWLHLHSDPNVHRMWGPCIWPSSQQLETICCSCKPCADVYRSAVLCTMYFVHVQCFTVSNTARVLLTVKHCGLLCGMDLIRVPTIQERVRQIYNSEALIYYGSWLWNASLNLRCLVLFWKSTDENRFSSVDQSWSNQHAELRWLFLQKDVDKRTVRL